MSIGYDWFTVLPDSPAAASVARRLAAVAGATVVLRHPSGRPCLIGSFPHDPVVSATAGPVRLAVIGHCPVTAAALERHAARLDHLDDADRLARALAGSVHLVVAHQGRVRVQGSASGLRRVFHTRLPAGTEGSPGMAADRADVLAALIGAEVDPEHLALRLLTFLPPALSAPLWKGVHAVPPGSAACLEAGGAVRVRRWWSPPEPRLSLEQAAPALADALRDAVAARVPAGGVVAADLSGGLDSTPICFLAQDAARRRDTRQLTVRYRVDDPAHDDEAWARLAAAHLDGEHLVLGFDEMPARYEGVADPVTGLDEPLPLLFGWRRESAVAGLLAGRGARVRLSGHGGDEVTQPLPCYLHDLAIVRPLALPARLRAFRAQSRWSRAEVAMALAERRRYAPWLAGRADRLTMAPAASAPDFGWDPPMRLPAWIHPDAAATVVRLARRAAGRARPLAALRSQHQTLSLVRHNAGMYRLMHRLTARYGAALHLPFLDDRVIEACLSARIDQRARPGHYKPLIVAAMTGHMPAQCLGRTTKGQFSSEIYQGLRRHRDQLAALAADSRLAELRLADAAALRQAVVRPLVDGQDLDLRLLVAMENWLRALPARPAAAFPGAGGRAAAPLGRGRS
ncbi:asparagine synthase-related protein [Nonomuraea candida]|uniref:asparagine synthase-related protein n=1 Tax=Nonomuraea candida TaxID=359159 RepID=UPI0012F8B09A|nr:asparagine synthase-related protein [Nonomuraea candida]